MPNDRYGEWADRYDRMRSDNPERLLFFRTLFAEHSVKSVLDCACGTGHDLIALHRMGLHVEGSDLSGAMLEQARRNIAGAEACIPLRQLDFRDLREAYDEPFDAVVCLSNSINELLDDGDVLRALGSMRAVLRPEGVLVIDQGQTDASMRNPPLYAPVGNDPHYTRVFVMEYQDRLMTVHVLDFAHSHNETSMHEAEVTLKIRLAADWRGLLTEAGFTSIDLAGDWSGAPYDIESSRRLIAVATR